MLGYEKQPWQTELGYAAPQGPTSRGYQQQPPGQPQQQAWSQQQYPPQPPPFAPLSSPYPYEPTPSYPLPQDFSSPLPSPYESAPQGQYDPRSFTQGPYSSPLVHRISMALRRRQQQHWGSPQGQCGSEKPHSVRFTFTGTPETILNSQIHDPYGGTPFVVATDKKKHTTMRASNGAALALIDWDRPSPVMHYEGKKVKCKEWLVCERDEKLFVADRTRVFQHAGKGYRWTQRNEKACLEPLDRPGHNILTASDQNGPVEVDAFQESLVVPGLLEAAMIGIVVMLTGQNPKPEGKSSTVKLLTTVTAVIGASLAMAF
ncbi:hypothetical protein BC826DRAFT_1188907 [Russula brevipes]|nr:hypothetical protein BC826DRAFT_1188907 [Russula brevipes]